MFLIEWIIKQSSASINTSAKSFKKSFKKSTKNQKGETKKPSKEEEEEEDVKASAHSVGPISRLDRMPGLLHDDREILQMQVVLPALGTDHQERTVRTTPDPRLSFNRLSKK